MKKALLACVLLLFVFGCRTFQSIGDLAQDLAQYCRENPNAGGLCGPPRLVCSPHPSTWHQPPVWCSSNEPPCWQTSSAQANLCTYVCAPGVFSAPLTCPTNPTPVPTATPTVPPPVPTPTPTVPTPVPTVGAVHPPTLSRFKVQNIDRTSTREPGKCGCANPCDGPKFLNDNLCEPGSTPLFRANAQTSPGPSGPCDTDHAATFNTVCGKREWLVPPHISVEGAASWVRSDENPFQTFVTFIPGKCFKICTWANDGDKTIDDKISVPADAGNMTCATHCY